MVNKLMKMLFSPKMCKRVTDHQFDMRDSLNVFKNPLCKICGKRMSEVIPLNKPFAVPYNSKFIIIRKEYHA